QSFQQSLFQDSGMYQIAELFRHALNFQSLTYTQPLQIFHFQFSFHATPGWPYDFQQHLYKHQTSASFLPQRLLSSRVLSVLPANATPENATRVSSLSRVGPHWRTGCRTLANDAKSGCC